MNTLSLVIPCFNEAERLSKADFLDALAKWPWVSFCFVDDGSTDSTAEKIAHLERLSPSVRALYLPKNMGKAEAVRAGVRYLCNNACADYIGFWDADLATPLDEIKPMVEWADRGYDAIMGLRLMRLGAKVKRKPMRHYLGRCFATVASLMLDLPVYDTQCGAKLFRTEVVESIFPEQFITRWLFDVELLARYKKVYGKERAIAKIYEFPLFQWQDIDGSQLKSRDFFKAPVELMKIKRKYK